MSFVSGSCSNGTTTDANSLFESKSKSVGPTMLKREQWGEMFYDSDCIFID